jgi:acetyl esterase/lipase
MGGVRGEQVTGKLPRLKHAVLYLHGGGYCIGSPYSYRILTGSIARQTGIPVYAPDYRLAPEHPHPAALEDALAAYRWLIADGYLPQCIAVVGDSAGAGLTVALCLALRNEHERLPAAIALLSPWLDLAGRGESFDQLAERDPVLSPEGLKRWARDYLGELPADHPLCSPLYAELTGLPPMLIHVGSEEIVLSDSTRFAERARKAGVSVQLHQYQGLWHDFQLHLGVLRESGAAVKEIAKFVRDNLGSQEARAA